MNIALDTARLDDLATANGELLTGGSNRPIQLNEPGSIWYVAEGAVDVFAARTGDDGSPVDFKHLLRARVGRLLFAVDECNSPLVLVARGLPDSTIRRMPVDVLDGSGLDGTIARQVDEWVSDVSDAVVRDFTYRPRIDRLVANGTEENVEDAATLSARQGVVWVSSKDGNAAYLGTEYPAPDGPGYVPVTTAGWLDVQRFTDVRCASSSTLLSNRMLLAATLEFNEMALRADDLNRRLLLADVSNLQVASDRYRRGSEENARRSLFGILDTKRQESGERPDLPGALQRIGDHEGITFRMPDRRATHQASADDGPSLAGVMLASGVRIRRVSLHASQRWWLGDAGAMLAMRKSDGAPVALVPGTMGRYRMTEPGQKRSRQVNSRLAATLEQDAYFFYRPLPHDQPAGARQMLSLAFNRTTGDLVWLMIAGFLAGMSALVPALLLGVFADQVLPSGSLRFLGTVTAAAMLAAISFGILRMLQGTALMRLEGRAAARASAAIWDRILDLPSHFFRRFTAGELATRAMTFHELRDQVAGIVAGALLSVVFLLPTFILLLLYDISLGLLCLGLGMTSLAVTMGLGLLQVSHHRKRLAIMRHIAGTLLQLISGVGKLRTTGSEGTAFAMWAQGYRDQKQAEIRIGAYNEHLVAFTASAPVFAAAALFIVGMKAGDDGLPVGNFLAVYAAFMVFFTAISQMGAVFSAIAAIVPAAEQVKPILAEPRRNPPTGYAATDLKGDVRLDRVTFRYSDTGPMVLQDVSIHARPGEFVALVGASGSGKSTIFRLLLGLEKPLSGVVYYDGHDLDQLNWTAVRNRIGVVVQDSPLRPQTVLDNIIGIGDDLTIDDAWRAARLASVEQEISSMPMEMFTATSESARAFSGGQVQRFMLAAALVRDPSVLLLDEATNWLDNRTQADVMEQIEKLSVTRIVSAHRLSTIRRADRIYVIQEGQVAQQGTFESLMEEDGIFRDMARRQIT